MRKKIAFAICGLLCGAVIFSVFARLDRARPPVTLYDEPIDDLSRLSQDPVDWLTDAPETRWLSDERQREIAEASMADFFSPWHGGDAPSEHKISDAPSESKTGDAPSGQKIGDAPSELKNGDVQNEQKIGDAPDMTWAAKILDDEIWAENLSRWTDEAKKSLLDDARLASYPSLDFRAIVVRNTSARALPTDRPAFRSPELAGEGFPFDHFQESAVPIGTPLRVRHSNSRGDWLLCETCAFAGWIKSEDLAPADDSFVQAYENGRYAAIVDDDSPLRDEHGRSVCTAQIGTIFPTDFDGALLVPVKNFSGAANFLRAFASSGCVVPYPLPFTAGNVAAQAKKFMGKLYGWGGMFGNRDCSSTMRDLFIPFGFLLPRNSRRQATSGECVMLEGKSDDEKFAAIRNFGVPFRSLICMKGHVGLFLGLTDRGEPVMLHNLWGLRLLPKRNSDSEGRLVVGRTVITTLTPGAERKFLVRPDSLTSRLLSLTRLAGAGGTKPARELNF